jgi:hypothetical protein
MALPLDAVTIAETLAQCGYESGYVGKWYLGNSQSFQPDRQGYGLSAVIAGALPLIGTLRYHIVSTSQISIIILTTITKGESNESCWPTRSGMDRTCIPQGRAGKPEQRRT